MTTQKQIEARRSNGRLSHGPKTEAGKAASSQNRLQHGFFSRNPVLPGEDVTEWNEFSGALTASLAPAGVAELILAENIVRAAWRLRRAACFETGILTTELYMDEREIARDAARREVYDLTALDSEGAEDVEKCEAFIDRGVAALEAAEHPDNSLGRAFIRDAKSVNGLWRLSRYETSIDRALHRNLRTLLDLQNARKVNLRNDLTEGLNVVDAEAYGSNPAVATM